MKQIVEYEHIQSTPNVLKADLKRAASQRWKVAFITKTCNYFDVVLERPAKQKK